MTASSKNISKNRIGFIRQDAIMRASVPPKRRMRMLWNRFLGKRRRSEFSAYCSKLLGSFGRFGYFGYFGRFSPVSPSTSRRLVTGGAISITLVHLGVSIAAMSRFISPQSPSERALGYTLGLSLYLLTDYIVTSSIAASERAIPTTLETDLD